MKFEVKIKNIGKLDNAVIRVDRFTVLAGPNNSGKSFVSKILYSVITALRTDPVKQYFSSLYERLDTDFVGKFGAPSSGLEGEPPEFEFARKIRALLHFIYEQQVLHSSQIDRTFANLIERVDAVLDVEKRLEESLSRFDEFRNVIKELKKIKKEINGQQFCEFLGRSRNSLLEQTFTEIFQVSRASSIANVANDPFCIDIENTVKITNSDGNFKLELREDGYSFLHDFSTVTYLESSISLELIRALEWIASNENHSDSGQVRISGVPGYFYDLARALKIEAVGEIAFPELYGKLTGDDVLGGRLNYSEDGRILFQENGKKLDLSVTAKGITNFGLLALLIERKVLDKRSFLFIDEPEAHLHPSWQVIMAETLFELAKQGVHVVFATQSIEILKWLEVHIKKNPEDESIVALNQFPIVDSPLLDQSVNYDSEVILSNIKQDLAKPFSKLYIDGI